MHYLKEVSQDGHEKYRLDESLVKVAGGGVQALGYFDQVIGEEVDSIQYIAVINVSKALRRTRHSRGGQILLWILVFWD